jgi:aspartate carbamoyltransferase
MPDAHISKLNGIFKGQDILSLKQFDPKSLKVLFKHTAAMAKIAKHAQASDILKGTIVTLIFYEPSSRTFGSFAASVKQLGGQTIEIQNPQQFSSVAKGETLEDTIRTFEAYSDAIVIRHPQMGAAAQAAEAATFVPVINAGDGVGEHPTQALLDLYTIYEKFGRLDGLTGVMAGDLLNGRTVHSLLNGLSLFKKNIMYLLSPKNLRLTRADFLLFQDRGLTLHEIHSEKEIPKNADFWYWTRVQKERFANLSEYEKVKHSFIVTPELLKKYASKDMILMHPLPRVGEIDTAVDADSRAVYLKSEIRNGMYIRMALLALVLGKVS